jgi:hypothetical protein
MPRICAAKTNPEEESGDEGIDSDDQDSAGNSGFARLGAGLNSHARHHWARAGVDDEYFSSDGEAPYARPPRVANRRDATQEDIEFEQQVGATGQCECGTLQCCDCVHESICLEELCVRLNHLRLIITFSFIWIDLVCWLWPGRGR